MSSGCGDVLSLEDLKTAKKHQLFEAEVITGKLGGVATGADIDYATNQVTGQTQKTLPAVLRDAGFRSAPFTFATGGTLSADDADLAVLWPGPSGNGLYYSWHGALPKTIPAGSSPATTGGESDTAWRLVGDLGLRRDLAQTSGAELVGFQQTGTGAVATTIDAKLKQIVMAQDFGVKMDGTDSTAAMNTFVAYVNAIPNPDGMMVGVVFGPGNITYNNTIHFTRPVDIICDGTVFTYTGSGNALHMGPDDLSGDYNALTGKTPFNKHYSIRGATFKGGTTSGYAINFAHWVTYCNVDRCNFRAFGGDGSWAINAEYNNWRVDVSNCLFEAHDDYQANSAPTRNFVRCPGYYEHPTEGKIVDLWSTLLTATNNRTEGVGWKRGGVAYWISGWRTVIEGGANNGMLTDVRISAGCADVILQNFYSEKPFGPEIGEVIKCIEFSYAGDPYFTGSKADGGAGLVDNGPSPWIKRLTIDGSYANFGNEVHPTTCFSQFNQNVALQEFNIDRATFVHSYNPLIPAPEIAGHSDWSIGDIRFDGEPAPTSRLIEGAYASVYKTSYKSRTRNLIVTPTASSIVTGFEAPAPVNTNFGTTGLSATSNGTGGLVRLTKRATDNTSASYERNRLDMQNSVYDLSCTSVASGMTYLHLSWDTSISPFKMQGTEMCLSFYAKSYNSTVTLDGFLQTSSGVNSQSRGSVSVQTGEWFRYALNFKAVTMPLGASVTDTEVVKVTIALPTSSVFAVDLASPVLTIGSVSYPLAACY